MSGAASRLGDWVARSLKRKVFATLIGSLAFASLCFLAPLVIAYRGRILDERSFAATEINRLLQVALENAMLKRDIEGLRQIVGELGRQDRIAGVFIMTPRGEVRFASDQALLGRHIDPAGGLCVGCRPIAGPTGGVAGLMVMHDGRHVVRSVNPVHNREPCTQCHGPIETAPVNGILVVDYDATQVVRDTLIATLALSAAGAIVLFGAIGGIGWMLQRSVLSPVVRLTDATRLLALGQYGHRAEVAGRDELASLGASFNTMAVRVEESVRSTEQRERYLQSLIDAIPDGVRVIDAGYRMVMANAAYCRQQGRTLAEVMAQPCHRSSHGLDTPCPATLVTCPVHEIGRGRAGLTCRHRHVRADGTQFHVEVSAAPLEVEQESGKRHLVVEVIRDLTHEVEVSHEQRLSEIGLLAAGVAHEIRNPLASIRLGIASLGRELEGGRAAASTEYIRVIDEEIARCMDVTSRLLKLSAAPAEMPELVDLKTVVADVLSLLNAEALKNKVSIVLGIEGQPRIIGADSEMRMLVLNLAQNALHAMPNGGRLIVSGRTQGDTVTLEFEDTGVGIAPEDLAKIFDPFWSRRADGVRGTGLGLSICRGILANHGGHITATSELGRGTRFVVTLPSADAEPALVAATKVAVP